MTRPRKKDDARARRLIVRINDEEQARIRAQARAAGLPVSEYVRRASVDGRVTVHRESAYGMSLASQLRRIGNLLNQLTRLAHIDGELPPELQKKIPYSAGVNAKAKDAATARALVTFLRSQPAMDVLKRKGMDLP